ALPIFFALPTDLATASGQVTNAVFGFTSMLINLMRDHGHRRMAVAFDRPEPTFRHERVESYKANREAAPDILRQQVGLVREVVETLGITVLELPGYEADDIIATLATQARDAGMDVIVVTGDRDVYQLVEDPHVKVLYNRRGVSDYVLHDEAASRSAPACRRGSTCPTRPSGATRPTTCRACRGWGRRRPPGSSTPTAASTASSSTSTSSAPSCGPTWPSTSSRCAPTPR